MIVQPADSRPSRTAVVGYFIAIFMPLALLVGGIMAVISHLEQRSGIALIESAERQDVALNQSRLVTELAGTISDAVFLSRQSSLLRLLSVGGTEEREQARHDLVAFARTKQCYDAVRCFDAKGTPVMHVRFQSGRPGVPEDAGPEVPSGETRWEVLLDPGEVYLSPVEVVSGANGPGVPPKAVIRVAAPVCDADGNRLGSVLLDYLASVMFQKLRPENMLVLDPSGQILHGGRSGERFGIATGSGYTFGKRHPAVWEEIAGSESGQTRVADGLFTFATVRPLYDAARVLPEGVVSMRSKANGESRGYWWKIVSHIPPERLSGGARRLRGGFLWFYAVLVTMIAVVSWPYARLMARRKEMQERLREYATTDALTRVYNRAYGLSMLERLMNECSRLDRKLTVFMIDVNNLKRINDTQGHKAGDAAIQRVARALRDGLRVVDVVSRFGGDEFLVVLPFTSLDQATGAIERVRRNLRENAEADGCRPDFSYGGAEYDPAEGITMTKLLEIADKRMYEQKRTAGAGRTTVAMAQDTRAR